MKHLMQFLLLCCAPLFLIGCSSVRVATPIAPAEEVFTADELDGAWLMTFSDVDRTNRIPIEVRIFKDGLVRAAIVHWELEMPEIISLSGHFFKIGEQTYLQLQKDHDRDGYFFFLAEKTGDGLGRLLMPNDARFEAAVKAKELKGHVYSGQLGSDVTLREGKQLHAYLRKHGTAAFVKEAPLEFKKLD